MEGKIACLNIVRTQEKGDGSGTCMCVGVCVGGHI